MITIVLTNRNRELNIVKKCLASLNSQSDQDFEWFLVDYGSDVSYLKELKQLVKVYSKITYIQCPTSGQLWSKCRAINIAVKKASHPYFVVGDIDLIFHPEYISKLKQLANPSKVHYFQYGFLDALETSQEKPFKDYAIDFSGSKDVTGNTMFPTESLKEINGFDEFYQGWGAEDTDAQLRMKHKGLDICFYDEDILVKHQWHPKTYRSKTSTHPFHSVLERINHRYMEQTIQLKRTVVNTTMAWGKPTNSVDYAALQNPNKIITIQNSVIDLSALIGQLQQDDSSIMTIKVSPITKKEHYKNKIKKILGKKHTEIIPMEHVNNRLLEEIIKSHRNQAYHYTFNRQENKIELTINFSA
ncbi:glycosyltransferase family 2 protein [Olleya namhaensis]|uniref:glycosyltransferase family 2 protein n=1 Tax=Olleya namhaensis TaxID=1144750 RepID=UPI0024920134|nr:galactosyltransferase-related protein [Olleya namhaensis]